jgi:hypothetical protein
MNKIIYVLSPYRHGDPKVVTDRVYMCERYCAMLFNHGFYPICTTASGHHLVEQFQVTDDFEIWRDNCEAFIDIAGQVHVLMQHGWKESTGLADEIKYCKANGANLYFIEITANGDYIKHREAP